MAEGEQDLRELKSELNHTQLRADADDRFVATGKHFPAAWVADGRDRRPVVKEAERDLKQIQEDFERRGVYHTKGSQVNCSMVAFQHSPSPRAPSDAEAVDQLAEPSERFDLRLGALNQGSSHLADDLELDKSSQSASSGEESEQRHAENPQDSGRKAKELLPSSAEQSWAPEAAADETVELSYEATDTVELVSEQVSDTDFAHLDPDSSRYQIVVRDREVKLSTTSLRFVPDANPNFYATEKRRRRCFCIKVKRRGARAPSKPFSLMSPEERKERLSYLRFRIRVIASAALFIHCLSKHLQDSDQRKISKYHRKVYTESESEIGKEKTSTMSLNSADVLKTIWHIIMSVSLWFNLVSSPLIILWPEITDQQVEGKTLYYALWCNELCFLLDMIRKFFDPPKRGRQLDVYEVAIAYMKSTLILDVLATLPQVASGLKNTFVPLKIIRLYEVWLLHYPLEALVNLMYSQKAKRKVFVIVYACQTLCRIAMLLHYLAVVWLWVGSEYFLDFEDGY